MKKILSFLSAMSLVFFISSRATAQAVNRAPIRIVDRYPAAQHAAPVVLPVESGGGGGKTVTSALPGGQPGAFKAILPPMKPGGATGVGGNKGIPAGRPGGQLPGGVSGATGGAGATTPPIKRTTGTGATSPQ